MALALRYRIGVDEALFDKLNKVAPTGGREVGRLDARVRRVLRARSRQSL